MDVNLSDLLRFEPERGLIWLQDYRMVMLSACALGALRRELIETLGWDRARGLMKRFGYAAGVADGVALAERFPGATGANHMKLGPELHAVEGMARVVRIPGASDVDLEAGRYHVEAHWEQSFEAEQHLELLGPSDKPVCWTLVGYATGHSSTAAGQPTVVVETECQAMGHERCRFTATLASSRPDLERREANDYASQNLPEMLEGLLDTLKRQKKTLRSREKAIQKLQSEVERIRPRGRFVGASPVLNTALDTAQSVAPYDTTTLILGESGTGKELMARFIHDQSPRADKPFIAVNCSALPENLQEAELFGHAKGAFTGAVAANPGVFEAAHGGTLFLDEIGDLAPTAQTKILRVLQEGEVKRIGETRTRKVDTRVLAATHRDLTAMVRQRSFREDLYYRLSVVALTLPPLRDRDNDVLLLAEHFLARYTAQFRKALDGFSRDAACALAAYPWPGNVRELENVVQRGVILSKDSMFSLEDLPDHVVAGQPVGEAAVMSTPVMPTAGMSTERAAAPATPSDMDDPLAGITDGTERLRRALELADGNRTRAAELLGVSRTTLWRKMKTLESNPRADSA